MARVAIVFHSVTGTTKALAEAVAQGVMRISGVTAITLEVHSKDIVEGRYCNDTTLSTLASADAIIFGSPTFMGSVSAQFKAFADATGEIWGDQAWANKMAGGFTIGSSPSGDQLHTMQYLQIFANQHGMLWVGIDSHGRDENGIPNRLGAQSGVIAAAKGEVVDSDDILTAKYLGTRVAELTLKMT